MSFLSDLFEGHFSELGGDLTHHPLETAAAVAAPLALFAAPAALGGLGSLLGGSIGGGLSAAGEGLGSLFSGAEGLLGIGGAAGGAAADAGLTGFDALSAGLTPSGASAIGGGAAAGDVAAAGAPSLLSALPSASGDLPLGLAGNATDTVTATLPGAATAAPTGGDLGLLSLGQPAVNATLPGVATAAPTGAALGATPAAAGASTSGGLLDTVTNALSPTNLLGGAAKSIAANPLGTALAGGGLLYSVMSGQQMSDAQKALQQQAQQLSAQGQQLASYLLNGNLPPGLQKQLDQATAAAKARVISNYAAQGLSTDPTQNSALAQQLSLIDTQSVISMATIGQNLLQTGINETGLSSSLYTTLANLDQTQTARVGQAIASMAAALSPSKGLTLSLGGAKAA